LHKCLLKIINQLIMKKLLLLFLPILLLGLQVNAQLNSWSKRVYIEVSEGQGTTMNDFPVRLVYDTQTPIGVGIMDANGNDIRFASDSCGINQLHYWIESGINTDSTVVFVKADYVAANTSDSIFMFYGSSNTVAAVSNIDSVFTNYWISNGTDTTLFGTQTFEYFKLSSGDTLHLQADTMLELLANYCVIDGVVNGNAKGYLGVSTGSYSDGNGPGAGTYKTSDASSGGGYGGAGGDGGADSAPYAIGGIAYGANNTDTIQKGSSGGSSDNGNGGNGGGAISIRGIHTAIFGDILTQGGTSTFISAGTTGRAGGGGAGGGCLVNSDFIVFSGIINADGAEGGLGLSGGNDGGGGGAGGRIKLFYNDTLLNNGNTSVLGGIGGATTTAAGFDGSNGTVYEGSTGNNPKYQLVLNTAINNPGCPVASVNDLVSEPWIVYPNPTQGDVVIERQGNTSESKIEIFDMNGRLIISENIASYNSTNTYNLGNHGSGLYLIKITDSKHIECFKIIVK
jgi:Secretion system C-terminal sorting domain/Domain of unknown function (DUF2341)